jgi:hypothetical protein
VSAGSKLQKRVPALAWDRGGPLKKLLVVENTNIFAVRQYKVLSQLIQRLTPAAVKQRDFKLVTIRHKC